MESVATSKTTPQTRRRDNVLFLAHSNGPLSSFIKQSARALYRSKGILYFVTYGNAPPSTHAHRIGSLINVTLLHRVRGLEPPITKSHELQ